LESNQTAYYKTPIGTAKIIGNNDGIISVTVIEEKIETSIQVSTCLENCIIQLKEYFDGNRTQFDLKLNPQGTDFQKKVWNELNNIPYGSTRSYLDQSKKIGDPKAIRAVASANGKNPIWIIIPCHRVIGSDGSMTGYGGGIWRKKWLLAHESPAPQQSLF
jgi:methylated-DNA-[protein]-cysteine S-methyltransferase